VQKSTHFFYLRILRY